MFFKRLELHGFKSFAHKTAIDFQEGFTIVVGPNGCGKSNVLDAVRWVLGETSPKSLRGGRMSDVIFRGSQSLKPAGLSNITLTLDNEAGALKTPHREVAVTRRLFANGDSEYQINKQTCRMRDIHELFLDTGLGADGYSIIEQGQIGQMVAAKPNERRDIFEEAAGISRYKARREETVRKLARTEDDLTRLVDIVSEVERQCNSLKYQARKAERHRRLSRRLHRLKQRLFLLRHETLGQQFAASEAKLEELRRAFEESAARSAQAEAALSAEKERLEELQNQQQRLQQKRYELRGRLDKERHRVEMIAQQVSNIDDRVAAIDKELESYTSRLTTTRGTLEALERDFEDQERQLGSSNAELRAKLEQLDAVRTENEASTRALQELRRELHDLRARENTLSNDKRLAESLLERLRDDLDATEFQIKELTGQIEELAQQVQSHQANVHDHQATLQGLRAEAASIQDEIGKDDEAKRSLGERLDSLTKELNRATSRLQALRELEESYEGYFLGVKEILKASERREIEGIVGVVSSLLGVPKELEIAVEVALGSSVQDIVTLSLESAKQAVAYLKRINRGRATFVPLDFVHSEFPTQHLEPIWGRQGVLGLGKDLIKYDQEIDKAVRYLFGNTVFVQHLDIAVELEREGIRNRFVSLEGDVVNPRGVISGGSHQTRGLLSRQREIRQLTDKVRVLENDLEGLRREMQETKDRLGARYARAAEIQTEIHNLEIQENVARRDLQQAERDLREKKGQHASVEARLNQQQFDRIKHHEIVENSTKELEALAARIEEQESRVREKEQAAGDLLTRQQAMSEEVAVAREAQRGVENRVQTMRERLDEIRSSIDEARRDQEVREVEKTNLIASREQALLDRDEVEETLGKLAREFEEIDNLANDKSGEIESRSSVLRDLTSESQKALRDRNEKDNAAREVETRTAELRAQIEYLELEAEEEFGLTVDQIREELEAAIEAEREALEQRDQHEPQEPDEESAKPEDSEKAPPEEVEPATTPEDDAIDDPARLRALVTELREKLSRMGTVNEAAIEEYATQSERLEFLTAQRDDMIEAKEQLEEAIRKIDETTAQLFSDAYESIRTNFRTMFQRLFNGGDADLVLVEDEKFPEPGIEIHATPPGKKLSGSITLMSGGEKALTAIALMFALFQYRPSPICILDEIDAPLDDVNVARLCSALRQFAGSTQFLIITHNKITMGLADTIYGVTMQEPGVSKVVSVKFEEVEDQGLLEAAPAG